MQNVRLEEQSAMLNIIILMMIVIIMTVLIQTMIILIGCGDDSDYENVH